MRYTIILFAISALMFIPMLWPYVGTVGYVLYWPQVALPQVATIVITVVAAVLLLSMLVHLTLKRPKRASYSTLALGWALAVLLTAMVGSGAYFSYMLHLLPVHHLGSQTVDSQRYHLLGDFNYVDRYVFLYRCDVTGMLCQEEILVNDRTTRVGQLEIVSHGFDVQGLPVYHMQAISEAN